MSKQKWRGRTWRYVVHRYFPGVDLKMLDTILWNLTCYPFSSQLALKQLERVRRKAKPWNKGWHKRVYELIKIHDDEMTAALKEARANEL